LATTDYSLAHTLPANVEAERSILGAILLTISHTTRPPSISSQKTFHSTRTAAFSRAWSISRNLRVAIDIITLPEELDRRSELETIGGVAYISSLPRRSS